MIRANYVVFIVLPDECVSLVSFGHKEVDVVSWQSHLQVSLDQPKVGGVALQTVHAHDKVDPTPKTC